MGKKLTILACLLLVMVLLIMNTSAVAAGSSHGHWIVTGDEVVENKTITLDGNLIVKSRGSLTMRNVTLRLNCHYDGQYRIVVEPGGSMFINRSNITAADLEHRFAFIVKGDAFVMRDSELHGCGWGREGKDPSGIPEPAPVSYDTEGWSVAGLFIQTDRAVVESNLISNNFVAIVLKGRGITVRGNTINSNDFNPISVFGSDTYIGDNVIRHSVPSGWGRCIDLDGHNNTVANNTLSGESREGDAGCVSGIAVGQNSTSWGNTIDNNTLAGLNGFGICLGVAVFISSNNTVTNNTISAEEFGITVHGRNNRIEGNSIVRASTGIDLTYSYNNLLANNSLSEIGDDHHGIRLCHSSNNIIINNEISSVDSSGIYMWRSSKNNTIQGNTISSSQQGILILHSSDGNKISGNVISSTPSGIIVDASFGNMIHGNNFIDSGERHDNGDNRWDYDGRGNYWSDYVGQDRNGDSIGDEPASIQPRGIDNYPLMKPVTLQPAATPKLEPIPFKELPPFIAISGEEVWENQTIVLETELNIQDGGELTLRNVTLILGSESHAGYIRIKPGGSLYIYQSTITDTETGYGGRFEAEEGSTFVMRDSDWHGVYYSWWNEGFEIYADDAILANNTLTGVSIMLIHVSGGYMGNNTILDSLCPILLMGSSNLTIENNTISKSLRAAINLTSAYGGAEGESTNNLIYHNNFLFNDNMPEFKGLWEGNQAEDTGSNNRWDHDGEGNYWSDYQERYPAAWEHPEHKGIWDTPYWIPGGGNKDMYPLMPPTPIVRTKEVTDVTMHSATLNCDFTLGDYDSVEVYFEYRKAGETDWTGTATTTYNASGHHSDTISGLQPGTDYKFRAQVRYDDAIVSGEQRYFTTFDTTAPTVSITGIAEFVKELTSITGTALDNVALDKVQVVINNTTDNTYWDGNSWVFTETWLDATGTASWSFSMPTLTDGKAYEIKAKAIDKAGNESAVATDSFTYKTAPARGMNWWIWPIIGVIAAGTIGGILYRRHRRPAASASGNG